MTIKSLLLGSAAALIAVTGARAADAVVVAEPEPMDYVRICDTYGTGYYYIPGTETCLKIGGYLRYDIGIGDHVTYGYGVNTKGDPLKGDTYYKRARARLSLDARSETELGTLRSLINLNFNYTRNNGGTGDSFGINDAFIELGGFRIGKTDSLFSTFTGYAGAIISDDLQVPYGPFGTHQIAYTFTGEGGFSAAVALEEGSGGSVILDYMPHVVGGVAYKGGWGGVSVVGGYDSRLDEGAVKGRIDVNATEQLSLFLMAGYSTNDPAGTGIGNVNANNYYAQWNGDWAVWGGGSFKANDKLTVSAQVSYDEDENFAAVLAAPYKIVSGLTITPEVSYADNFDVANDGGHWGAFLRFQRSF
jgi:hypothetical protein